LIVAGFVASWFVAKDAPQFGLVQMAIGLLLLILVVWVLAFWPERWTRMLSGFISRAKRQRGRSTASQVEDRMSHECSESNAWFPCFDRRSLGVGAGGELIDDAHSVVTWNPTRAVTCEDRTASTASAPQ
jgi:hypothetical protein